MSVERFRLRRPLCDEVHAHVADPAGDWVKYEDYQQEVERLKEEQAELARLANARQDVIKEMHESRAAAEARADAAEKELREIAATLVGERMAIQEVEEELRRRANSAQDNLERVVGLEEALDLLRSKLEPTESHDGEGELAKERSDKPGSRDTIQAQYEGLREKIGEEIERLREKQHFAAAAAILEAEHFDPERAAKYRVLADERGEAARNLEDALDQIGGSGG